MRWDEMRWNGLGGNFPPASPSRATQSSHPIYLLAFSICQIAYLGKKKKEKKSAWGAAIGRFSCGGGARARRQPTLSDRSPRTIKQLTISRSECREKVSDPSYYLIMTYFSRNYLFLLVQRLKWLVLIELKLMGLTYTLYRSGEAEIILQRGGRRRRRRGGR